MGYFKTPSKNIDYDLYQDLKVVLVDFLYTVTGLVLVLCSFTVQ